VRKRETSTRSRAERPALAPAGEVVAFSAARRRPTDLRLAGARVDSHSPRCERYELVTAGRRAGDEGKRDEQRTDEKGDGG